ncbi:ABC transporter [Helicobacter didelphidarum]|uniref:ABC transporter n=1 Tax=Helicobacter didelphidarum TaxID=2040648 RepID=A0A3D8IJC5_9HELI|nr:zinc ABC transporter substrate-binding protein [Helicobacter didelphidarum]RDU65258.1 ABC transporter [Helicobacter didelphidarum]
MKKIYIIFIVSIFYTFSFLCANPPEKLTISVSIPPLYFFVNQIAKDKAIITTIIPTNKNAEIYEPDFASMEVIGKSEIFIGIGMPFEKIWIPKILNANKTQDKLYTIMLDEKLYSHSHAHLWLSLNNAKKITKILADEFSKYDSKNSAFYHENAQKLLTSIVALEAKIPVIINDMPHKDFIIYHPIFDEFAHEFNLIEHSLEKHGKKYGVADIISLSQLGKKIQIKRIFTQNKNNDIVTLAKSINAQVILIDPLSQDYLTNLESILQEISKSYE